MNHKQGSPPSWYKAELLGESNPIDLSKKDLDILLVDLQNSSLDSLEKIQQLDAKWNFTMIIVVNLLTVKKMIQPKESKQNKWEFVTPKYSEEQKGASLLEITKFGNGLTLAH